MNQYFALAALALAGCASNPGVQPLGGNRYFVSHEAASAFNGTAAQKAKAISEAIAYCSVRGKEAAIGTITEAKPPFIFGNFPRADVEFECK